MRAVKTESMYDYVAAADLDVYVVFPTVIRAGGRRDEAAGSCARRV